MVPPFLRSALWNRGEYLVNGLGHCGACHTERNALGAEKTGSAAFGGAMVAGWEAPPLTSLSHAPVPWTEPELFSYLRHGVTTQHGGPAGPMAVVVRNLGALPEADVQAMAHYLASFNTAPSVAARTAAATVLPGAAQRMFDTACGACHHEGAGPGQPGNNLPLALNSNLHSSRPDNLLRVVIEGIRDPAYAHLGWMPAYGGSLNDTQLAELAAYLRQRYAPGKPAWVDLEATVARVRARSVAP